MIGVRIRLLGVFLCATGVLSAAAFAADEVPLSSDDRRVLARAVEARRLAGEVLPGLWPGFNVRGIPLCLFRYGEVAILVGNPERVPEYRSLTGGEASVQVFHGEDQRLANGAAAVLGGRATALFDLAPGRRGSLPGPRGPASGHPPAEEAIGDMIQAMFGVHAVARGSGRPAGVSGKYPDSAEALAWANLEGAILLGGLEAPADRAPEEARAFVAVRRARWAEIGEALATAEATREFHEGLAAYTELEAFRRGAAKGVPASSPVLSDPTFASYRHADLMRDDRLAGLLRLLEAPAGLRGRAELTGAAQAFLLDRLDPAWRDRALGGGADLIGLVSQASGFQAGGAAELLRRAEERYGYAALVELARRDYRRIVQRRQESLRQFLERPGFLVRVVVPPGEVVQFRFDPEDRIDPGGPRFIHGRFLELELRGGRFRAHGAPSMTVYGASPADLREVSFVAGDDATWTLNGSLFLPRPGSMNAPEGIRIEGPGFELEGGSAHLFMSGQSVEVSFNPAPEPGSDPGTP